MTKLASHAAHDISINLEHVVVHIPYLQELVVVDRCGLLGSVISDAANQWLPYLTAVGYHRSENVRCTLLDGSSTTIDCASTL